MPQTLHSPDTGYGVVYPQMSMYGIIMTGCDKTHRMCCDSRVASKSQH